MKLRDVGGLVLSVARQNHLLPLALLWPLVLDHPERLDLLVVAVHRHDALDALLELFQLDDAHLLHPAKKLGQLLVAGLFHVQDYAGRRVLDHVDPVKVARQHGQLGLFGTGFPGLQKGIL